MKYLRTFLENKFENFEISENDFDDIIRKKKFLKLTKSQIQIIEKNFDVKILSKKIPKINNILGVVTYEEEENKKFYEKIDIYSFFAADDISISIYSLEDEWYIVYFYQSWKEDFIFKCDSFDGLIIKLKELYEKYICIECNGSGENKNCNNNDYVIKCDKCDGTGLKNI